MRSTRTPTLLLLAVVWAALTLTSFAAFAQDVVAQAEAPSGNYTHLTGDWKSNQGAVSLVVDMAGKVTGTFEGGGEFVGTIKDEVIRGKDADGNPTQTKVTQIIYTWTQTDSQGGSGFFSLNGDRLVGTWGYGKSTSNGGDWVLYR